MIANVYSVPRPLAGRQPRLPAKQCGHRSRTGKLQPPQLAQCCSISLPSRAPSKNVALTVSEMGTGLLAVSDIAHFILLDFADAITFGGKWHTDRHRPHARKPNDHAEAACSIIQR